MNHRTRTRRPVMTRRQLFSRAGLLGAAGIALPGFLGTPRLGETSCRLR